MVVIVFNKYSDWATNEAGILEEDIQEIQEYNAALTEADDTQELAKFKRKANTLDVNTLQIKVEDMITKASTLGVKEFHKTDPDAAKLFKDLIP